LNLIGIGPIDLKNDLINGAKLKNEKNFLFYTHIYQFEDIQEILSRFQTKFYSDHQWSFGVHQNTWICSLPFLFHQLKHFQHFENVLSNNDDILKHHHRLWSIMSHHSNRFISIN
jgi:hypothetical protein